MLARVGVIATVKALHRKKIDFGQLPDAHDIELVSAFFGPRNALGSVPIKGTCFNNNPLGSGRKWPAVNRLDDLTIAFVIKPTIMDRLDLPPTVTRSDILNLEVKVNLVIWGPKCP